MGPSRRPAPKKLQSHAFSPSVTTSHPTATPPSSSSALNGLNTSTLSYSPAVSTLSATSSVPLDHVTRTLPLGSASTRPTGIPTDGSSRKAAAMTRASMACVSCREAKHKCDGRPPSQLLGVSISSPLSRPQPSVERPPVQPTLYSADQRCTRCDLNDTACLWAPKAKLGRPSKKSMAAASPISEAETAVGREAKTFNDRSNSGNIRNQLSAMSSASQPFSSRSSGHIDAMVPPDEDELSWLTIPQQSYHRPNLHQQSSSQQAISDWMDPVVGHGGTVGPIMVNTPMSFHTTQQVIKSPTLPNHSGATPVYRQQQMRAQQEQQQQSGSQSMLPPPPSAAPQQHLRGISVGPWTTFPHASSQGNPHRSGQSSNLFDAHAHTHQSHLDRGHQPFLLDPPSRYGLAGAGIPQDGHPALPSGSQSSGSPSGSLSAGSLSGSLSGSISGSMSYSTAAYFPGQMRHPAPASARQSAPFHHSSAVSSPATTGAATAYSHSDPFTIRTGMQLYFSSAPRYCLALAPCQQYRIFASLERWAWLIPEQPRAQLPEEARDFLTLAQTIATVGWKLSREVSSSVLHSLFLQQARDGLGGIVSRPSEAFKSCPIPHLVSCVQALLLGSTLEYSIADVERSGTYLQKAADIIIELKVPVFDLASPVQDSSRTGERMVSYTGLTASHVPEMDLADDVRRCFWELCVTQTMFCAATSGDASMCLLRSGIPIDVKFPDSPPPSAESDYGLRVRAASLLLESVQSVPPNPSARLNRLEALNGVITDIAQQAKRRFDNGLTEESVEMTFTAFLMLNSARVQLIKMTFFPSLQDDLDSSVLTAGGLDEKSSLTAALPLQVARAAIKTIIQGADNIIELTRADNSPRPAFPNLYGSARLAVTAVLNHSPFHESSLLTASLAYVSAAALWKDLIDSMPHRQDDDRLASAARAASTSRALINALTKGSVKGGASASDAASPSARRGNRPEVDGKGDVAVVWVHHNVLSNLAFAHGILVAAGHVWPMAGRLAGEVANCRSLVDRRAPLDG